MHFFLEKRAWSKAKVSKSKSNLNYAGATIPGVSNMQRASSHHMPVLSLSVTEVVFFKCSTTFSSLAAFLGTTPTLIKK